MSESEAAQAQDPAAAAPLERLNWFERFAFRLLRWLNGPGHPLARLWQRCLRPILWLFIGRRVVVRGLERLAHLPADAPLLLVANHRSFFDLFVLVWILVGRRGLRHQVCFPVRANFFYENPLGLLLCLISSGGSMFPPFFRSADKRAFNNHAVELLCRQLREKRRLVGFHPEGRRNKTPDPYELLPAQPGAGKLVLEARPVVVPAFVTGLTSSLWREFWANVRGQDKVVAVFGAPMDPAIWPQGSRLALQKRVADQLLDRIRDLQPEERAARADGKPQ